MRCARPIPSLVASLRLVVEHSHNLRLISAAARPPHAHPPPPPPPAPLPRPVPPPPAAMEEQPLQLGKGGPEIASPLGMGLWSWGDSYVSRNARQRSADARRPCQVGSALASALLLLPCLTSPLPQPTCAFLQTWGHRGYDASLTTASMQARGGLGFVHGQRLLVRTAPTVPSPPGPAAAPTVPSPPAPAAGGVPNRVGRRLQPVRHGREL